MRRLFVAVGLAVAFTGMASPAVALAGDGQRTGGAILAPEGPAPATAATMARAAPPPMAVAAVRSDADAGF
jgi:hypothetical protein